MKLVGGLAICLTGWIFASFHTLHLMEESLAPALLGAYPGFLLSLSLVVTGGLLLKSGLSGEQVFRLYAWAVAGTFVMGGIAVALVFYQVFHGSEMADSGAILLNNLTGGFVGGLVIGLYDVVNLKTSSRFRRRYDTLESAYKLSYSAISREDEEGFYEDALHAVSDALGSDRVGVALLDGEGEKETVAQRGIDREDVASRLPWEHWEAKPEPVLEGDSDREGPGAGEPPSAAFPLTYQGELLGGLLVLYEAPHSFGRRDVQLGETASFHLALAVHKRRTERELERSEERYSALVEKSNDGIAIFREGRLVYGNPELRDSFGYPEGSEVRVPELVAPGDRERVMEEVESWLGEGSPEDGSRRLELEAVTSEGERVPVEVGLSRIEYGGEPAVAAIVRDVSERREREEKILDQKRRLTILNRIVRHDIRNDANLVQGWAESLSEEAGDGCSEVLGNIESVSEHIVELTETVGTALRAVEEGRVETGPVPLRETVEGSVEAAKTNFPGADVAVSGEIPDVDVEANELLSSVFDNLVNNGIVHNDSEKPTIRVSGRVEGGTAWVEISDDGPGIPDRMKESLFQKGEKGTDSVGTGVGLYLVKVLMQQYGGEVEVEEREPRGTTFNIGLNAC